MNFDTVSQFIIPELVLDIGPNVGASYLEAVKAWPRATFWLVEGNRECEKPLQSIIRDGDYLDINVLSDSPKEVDFYTLKDCSTATGAGYYREKTPFFEGDKAVVTKLQTCTLDRLVEGSDFWKKGNRLLLMLDTQGSELDILKGGEKTLGKADALIIELSRVEYNAGAPLCDEVDFWLTEHGFVVAEVLGDIVHPTQRDVIQNDVLYVRK